MMILEGALWAGRSNNLNLIRLFAAYAVLISHSFALYTGLREAEPLRDSTGFSLGEIAVWVFFGVSGLLISRSWDRSSVPLFVASRVFRIMPALIVSAVSTTIIGAFVTSLTWKAYWIHPETISYVPRFVTLVFMRDSLPGVFETNPFFPRAVNGSAWTLFYEVGCYAMVFLAGLGGRKIKGTMLAAIGIVGALWLAVDVFHLFEPSIRVGNFTKLGFPFAIGMLLYRARRIVPLSIVLIGSLGLLLWLSASSVFYSTIFVVFVVYSVFYLAYVPKGLLWFNSERIGDVSYGVYIYAFTIQQLVIYLVPHIGFTAYISLVTAIVLPLAYLSWHCIEKPCMAIGKTFGLALSGWCRSCLGGKAI